MGWNRMQSEQERKPQQSIRGFLPFTEGSTIEGELIAVRTKEEGRGYALIRANHPLVCNVRDAESKTGQGNAVAGDVIGIRKTGATKRLWELPIGSRIRVTYVKAGERTQMNPKNQQMETNLYHEIAIDVWQEGN
jgi:hypothetical protein